MRLNYSKFILIILIMTAVVIGVVSLVYAGGENGMVEQDHFAVFENSSGNIGTQIGSDDTALSITPGQKIFLAIQGNWTTQSKDMDLSVYWREWEGTWAATQPINTNSDIVWEFWDSNYANLNAGLSVHWGDSVDTCVLEIPTDANDPAGKSEIYYVVEAPTTGGRYELVIYDVENDEIAETITIPVDITVGPPPVASVSQKYYRWRYDDGGE